MWKKLYVLISCLVLLGCGSPPYLHEYYAPKQQRLSRILNDCKVYGMNYAIKDPFCQRAVEKGIYWDLPKYYKNCCCCVDTPIPVSHCLTGR